MGTFVLTALTVFVVSMVLVLTFRLLSNVKPSKRKVQEDLKKMKEELTALSKDLIPITKEELELFSQKQINQIKKRRSTANAQGVFTTIFDEPIVAYAYKKYNTSGTNALLYARTSDHEFAYRIENGEIKIVADNKLVGVLKPNGVLYGGQKQRMLARINREGEELIPVIINEKEVGNLTKALPPAKNNNVNSRAFEFIRDDMDPEEKKVFLSLALYELVNRTV